jgi:hypothetical protein
VFSVNRPTSTSQLEAALTDVEALSPEQRPAVARGLALLWEAFVGKFEGLDGFLSSSAENRATYLAELRSATDRMSGSEPLANTRYSVGPTLLMVYLEALARHDMTPAARDLGRSVAALINEGTKLRAVPAKPSIVRDASDRTE